jgi:general secretion pathway protein J
MMLRLDGMRLSRQRGFTLLELLVAITLLGLIATMAFSGFRLGTRAWDTAAGREHDVYLVQQMLRTRLSAAYAAAELDLGLPLGADDGEPFFEGGPDHVSFVAPLPDLFGVGGLYRVVVEVVEAEGRRDLVMSWQLWRPEANGNLDDPDGRNRRVLLDGVGDAAFTFFGPAEHTGEAVWQDSWRERSTLPLLVRLVLEHPEKPWPPLVVAPKLAADDQSRL